MVEVGSYRARGDAEIAQTALDAAGISYVLTADDAGGAYPLTGTARLLVGDADADEATVVLAERPDTTREEGR